MLRPLLGSRSSSSERLKQCCVFRSSRSERFVFGVNPANMLCWALARTRAQMLRAPTSRHGRV
eukprot:12654851-Alexandrium_andersonii.AAC.1